MNEQVKIGIRYHAVASARDVLVVAGVISLIGGAISFLARPYWEPLL